MDEVSSYVRLNLPLPRRQGRAEEKREPVSDIDTEVVDSLKVLDLDGRLEKRTYRHVCSLSFGCKADISGVGRKRQRFPVIR